MTEIIPIRLTAVNVYLVKGQRPILVDSGTSGSLPALLKALSEHGVDPRDLSLLIQTHTHVDHAGSTHALQEQYGVPVAVHAAESFDLAHGGKIPEDKPASFFTRLITRLVPQGFSPAQPDVEVHATLDLRPYGVEGCAVHTPGHSPGSLTVIVDGCGAIAGDLLMGGNLVGLINPTRPNFPMIIDDKALLLASVRRVLDFAPERIYIGHGGPFHCEDVARWLERVSA